MNLLAFEHNLNYVELQLFFVRQEMWSYWKTNTWRDSVFYPDIMCNSWLEVVCSWNAPNHILHLPLVIFPLSGLSLASHCLFYTTFTIKGRKFSSVHANQSCKTRIRLRHSSNGTYEPLQITLDEFSVPWVHTAWPMFGFGPSPRTRNFRRLVFGCMYVCYMKASWMVFCDTFFLH